MTNPPPILLLPRRPLLLPKSLQKNRNIRSSLLLKIPRKNNLLLKCRRRQLLSRSKSTRPSRDLKLSTNN
jgi:hypothetical protein